MTDPLTTLLLIAAIFVLADLLLAGGAMSMTGMSMVVGAFAHPLVAGALILVVAVVLLNSAGAR